MAEAKDSESDSKVEHNSVDLCFLMDCTGSMAKYIEAAKNDITETTTRVATEVPDVRINYGFVAYRDWCDESKPAKRIETFPFETSVSNFQSFVGTLAATGGGDYPEDVLGGLWQCSTMEWSSDTRVVFHIFDAPPHGRPLFHDNASESYPDGHPEDKPLSEIFNAFRDLDVDYYMCKLNNDLDKTVRVFEEHARSVDYESLEERREIDLSKIMLDVAAAVLESMTVRLSRKGRRRRADALFRPRLTASTYKVYCGIDFGTHGSAYAFCTAAEPHPRVEQNWNGTSGDVKTLTNLCLGANKKCVEYPNGFGDAALEHYLNLNPDEQAAHFFFRRFKMALYDGAHEGEEKVEIESTILAANGRSVRSEVVLVEALKFMVAHVMDQIESRYHVSDRSDVQWIVTVPAIWSQRSRRIMERAAYKAGVPRVKHDQLIVALEPECASIVVRDHLGLGVGECYMLVDCGGGTVDIACHELENDTDIKEIHQATGGPWGATFIDDEWLALLRHVLGDAVMDQLDEEVKTEDPSLIEELIKDFNNAKRHATPVEESRNVKIPALKNILRNVFGRAEAINEHLATTEYRGITGGITYRRGWLTLSREVWDALFGTVIGHIIEHIRGLLELPHLHDRIRTLCIVGGFAESAILMAQLRAAFPDRRVFRPDKPILAVVQGAAKFGLIPTAIRERRAPKTIGIAIRDAYNEETDRGHRKIRDRVAHMDCVDGVFFAFVKSGQAIPEDMPPIIHYFEPTHPDHFVIQVFETDDPTPPRFVPERPAATIGPLEYPPDYERDFDILVALSFAGRLTRVKVQFGDAEPVEVELAWT